MIEATIMPELMAPKDALISPDADYNHRVTGHGRAADDVRPQRAAPVDGIHNHDFAGRLIVV